jgi:hypothetical protein
MHEPKNAAAHLDAAIEAWDVVQNLLWQCFASARQ